MRSDLPRQHGFLARTYSVPIFLSLVALVLFITNPVGLSVVRIELLASILGVAISLSFVTSALTVTEHKRLKKTFGFLRIVTVPYLRSHSESVTGTLLAYRGDLTQIQALIFLHLDSNFDVISSSLDSSWLQFIHSQDFMDTIKHDDELQKIADVEFEVLSFTKSLAAQSVKAKYLLDTFPLLQEHERNTIILQAQQIRDDLQESAQGLMDYTNQLNVVLETLLINNGARPAPHSDIGEQ